MFPRSYAIYDAIYAAGKGKNYAREAERLHTVLQQHLRSGGNTLLDVACGTGNHLAHLKAWYQCEGVDLNDNMLDIARGRVPDIHFAVADMVDIDLSRQFDVVTCLFSSIGYVRSLDRLRRAIVSMANHLKPGGCLVVEPWLAPKDYRPGSVHADYVDEPELKIARMTKGERDGRLSLLDMHYLVATPEDGVRHYVERHELGMFTREEFRSAFAQAGLDPTYDDEGLFGRGMWIGVRPEES